ncbi:hypothetical protein FRC18_010425 [Serendipita sp. 400]|nr:hypothetical protein FRC18_010425 [Serendipita sp. 400]
MKFFITSITVLVLYAASSVVAAPLPAPAIAAYGGNMMKRDLSGVVNLERRHPPPGYICKGSPGRTAWCTPPSRANGVTPGQDPSG